MPALNFNKRFVPSVELGLYDQENPKGKRQTIRAGSRFTFGDRIYLYTGMRTKQCRKLGESTAKIVLPIRLSSSGGVLAGKRIDFEELTRIAKKDGFLTATEMLDWFEKTHGLPFSGQLIRW